MMKLLAPVFTCGAVIKHRVETFAIEREVVLMPKVGTRECVCPICDAAQMTIVRDDVFYRAACENGCGQASILR